MGAFVDSAVLVEMPSDRARAHRRESILGRTRVAPNPRNMARRVSCLNGIESAIAAEQGGATRVELCDNLMEGGTTPSQGMVAMVADTLKIDVLAMIRPRGGDFLYTAMEFAVMQHNVQMMHQHGIMGVVFGMLHNGKLHRCIEEVAAARPNHPPSTHVDFDIASPSEPIAPHSTPHESRAPVPFPQYAARFQPSLQQPASRSSRRPPAFVAP